jgi:RNA polymerase sigma-70 factor (ECF subfamily)
MNKHSGLRVTETDLIQQARRGDPEAWESLTRTHQEAVFRLAYLLLGDPDDAEDAAQEAFVRAYYALKRFDPARPLRPWLMQIVSNLASNRRRSLGRYLNALARFVKEPARTQSSVPEDDSQSLWQAVRQLKFEFQQVIYLRYFLDMSEEQMSATLGIPAGTVKSRLHRALGALREIIASQYPQLEETFTP